MNLGQFFEHWSIAENPFRGEEARHDAVFARLSGEPAGAAAASQDRVDAAAAVREGDQATGAGPKKGPHARHSDFEKIVGDLSSPSTSIVFGEKGSGKTALRLQIEGRVHGHNRAHAGRRVFMIAHDDLNAVIDRYHERSGQDTALESLKHFRLVDHIDAMLLWAVPRLVDALLEDPAPEGAVDLAEGQKKSLRKLDPGARRDLLLLQAVYDRPDTADLRTGRLRRALRLPRGGGRLAWDVAMFAGWILPLAALIGWWQLGGLPDVVWWVLVAAGAVAWAAAGVKRLVLDRLAMQRLGRKVRKQVRVSARGDASYAHSFAQLDPVIATQQNLPTTDADDTRYAMLDRLRRVLAPLGYRGLLIVIDRVDEPSLISGNPEAMRALIWPLLSNKFLQMDGVGVKMLLPIELRHALYRESSAFFQEARLDKQNLVDRLSWTGAMLYDLCDARLKACLEPGAKPITLVDLFAEDVTERDLVDALDQMHQPRDAFKFLYQCLSEHCSNVTAQEQAWRVPRLVLETVRKQQSERVQQLYRGISPA
ncbi:hypothetical protein AY599_25105 [Leptolyngbya valderiana BDU 20041]|nr:hypothetical protein AY599_25105 [Leptolyngbya valderiana BDU 20041]